MTYFQILLVFIVPPVLVLANSLRGKATRTAWTLLGILVIVAVVYTTPWDNYLVANAIWWYDPALVTGITLGWVPIEEYTFFVLQTLFTGMFYLLVRRQMKNTNAAHRQYSKRVRWFSLLLVAAIWLVSVGLLLAGGDRWRYLAITVAWAFLPIMLQVGFGADFLLAGWKTVGLAIALPTLYLCAVDWMAIGFGTWTISPDYTTGLLLAGQLPVEEAVFFLLTNVLVVFGLHLGLHPQSMERLPERFRRDS